MGSSIGSLLGQLARDAVEIPYLVKVVIKSVNKDDNTCTCVPIGEWAEDYEKEYDMEYYNVVYSTGAVPKEGSSAYLGFSQQFQPVLLIAEEVSGATFGGSTNKENVGDEDTQSEVTKRLIAKRGARLTDGNSQLEISSDGVWGINMPYYSFTTLYQQGQIELMANKMNLAVDKNGSIYLGKSNVEVVKVYDDDVTQIGAAIDGKEELDPIKMLELKNYQGFMTFLCENVKLPEPEYNTKRKEFEANHPGFRWVEYAPVYEDYPNNTKPLPALDKDLKVRRVRHIIQILIRLEARGLQRKNVFGYDKVNNDLLFQSLVGTSKEKIQSLPQTSLSVDAEIGKIIDFIRTVDTYRVAPKLYSELLRLYINKREDIVLKKVPQSTDLTLLSQGISRANQIVNYIDTNVEKNGSADKPLRYYSYTQSKSLYSINTVLNDILEAQKTMNKAMSDFMKDVQSGNLVVPVSGVPTPVVEVVPKIASYLSTLNESNGELSRTVDEVNSLFAKEPFDLFNEFKE